MDSKSKINRIRRSVFVHGDFFITKHPYEKYLFMPKRLLDNGIIEDLADSWMPLCDAKSVIMRLSSKKD